ncbi:mitotic-spindle organizing protein 2 isoform X1 [Silurus meridionalis]|uniref:mitotic-spindle organizing protein 2 isoform X1 n=1 Tax=Silurus meridionalis TaxID=175797 RepID=UPI001EEC4FB0|nr:mitotic-spindle organizing protein 2 isoform X1 [Silurus meridionalis]XP_046723029.1 mitotic-spindle organizing protein 2 isoform X1 [Silurus meridionalis]XP_046723030.1 mitotic-spindle organizing protein 2 isoform X1 [Silurus meridionalis]XP_046723031.1 mitotic-spindle organizing protein 2 isoform X1 [Silurus meridionalis]XP_046723032.1 mitotic-spindle organizing protein 2 isoform X1 [Silurus meridionalis]
MSSQSSQPGSMPTAPDSPSLGVTVSGNVQKYSVKKKKVLNAEEAELFELTQAAGIVMDQEVFKIIVDLLKMNVAPLAVFQTLKAMCAGQKISDTIAPDLSTATEAREEDPKVPDKSAKKATPQAPPTAPASHSQRAGSKIVVYSSGEQSSPLSQVRSKSGTGHAEKREQRVPRQASATRGQKSAKSSGSSSSSSQLTSN